MSTNDTLAVLRETMPERLWMFAEHYLTQGLDARASAAHVGAPGQEHALMKDRRTLAYLTALAEHTRDANQQIRDSVVGALARMALFDPKDAVREGSMMLRSMSEMPDNVRLAIESWEVKPDGSFKVKFVRRLDCIRLLLELTGDLPTAGASAGVKIVFEKARGADQ